MSRTFNERLRREAADGTITTRTIIVESGPINGAAGKPDGYAVTILDVVIDNDAGRPIQNTIKFGTKKLATEYANQQLQKSFSDGFDFTPTTLELQIANARDAQCEGVSPNQITDREKEIQRRNVLTFSRERLHNQLNSS
jgi:hypothetical protein